MIIGDVSYPVWARSCYQLHKVLLLTTVVSGSVNKLVSQGSWLPEVLYCFVFCLRFSFFQASFFATYGRKYGTVYWNYYEHREIFHQSTWCGMPKCKPLQKTWIDWDIEQILHVLIWTDHVIFFWFYSVLLQQIDDLSLFHYVSDHVVLITPDEQPFGTTTTFPAPFFPADYEDIVLSSRYQPCQIRILSEVCMTFHWYIICYIVNVTW